MLEGGSSCSRVNCYGATIANVLFLSKYFTTLVVLSSVANKFYFLLVIIGLL